MTLSLRSSKASPMKFTVCWNLVSVNCASPVSHWKGNSDGGTEMKSQEESLRRSEDRAYLLL